MNKTTTVLHKTKIKWNNMFKKFIQQWTVLLKRFFLNKNSDIVSSFQVKFVPEELVDLKKNNLLWHAYGTMGNKNTEAS